MKKYTKICSICGIHNEPFAEVCNCGESLLFIIPSEVEEPTVEIEVKRKYRRCKVCGTINYFVNGKDVRKCSNSGCFNDELYRSKIEIEGNECENKENKETSKVLKLIERISRTELEIPVEGAVLGRMGNVCPKFFADYEYVGRTHCEIKYSNGYWQVKDMSRNKTRINGREVSKEYFEELKYGDVLSLANVHFEVKY